MNYYLFQLLDGSSLDKVEKELQKKGLKDPFIIEEDETGQILIGGYSRKNIETTQAVLIEKKKATIDWEEQWALCAENFKEGKAHIQIGDHTLLLTPGAGFGDLSHPTTALMLEMMKIYVPNEHILDIGTGSGILSLAALFLGARSAMGIDIDPKAIAHAKQNAKLNHLKASFRKNLPKKLPEEAIFLMNMIFPEQRAFCPNQFNSSAKMWIVSGILESQKKEYLLQSAKWHWELLSEFSKRDWCGFVFAVRKE